MMFSKTKNHTMGYLTKRKAGAITPTFNKLLVQIF